MLDLPVELRRHCINFSNDTASLKAARLVNRDLSTLASEALFHTAMLRNNDQSAATLTKLIESPLCSLIRRLVVHTSDDPNFQGSSECQPDIEESFIQVSKLIPRMKKLEEVELNFACECAIEDDGGWDKDVAETVSFRTEVLELLFAALRQIEGVRSLSISNLQDHMPSTVFNSEDFKAVRGRLTKLALHIATEYDDASPENNILMPACQLGFRNSLPDIWLKPMANQLTHLTIYGAECIWGVWPFTDFREMAPFPRLKSLSLGNLSIVHDWQIEWILAHAPTLEELLLDDCPIIIALYMNAEQVKPNFPDLPPLETKNNDSELRYYKTVDMRWHHIFDRFRTGLSLLRRFALGSGDWSGNCAFQERYALKNQIQASNYYVFHCGIGPTQWTSMGNVNNVDGEKAYKFHMRNLDSKVVKRPQCEDEDQSALEALVDAMRRRAGGTSA
jgi:hypothetical protein